VKYEPICPFLFSNAYIHDIELLGMVNHFIKHNQLNFFTNPLVDGQVNATVLGVYSPDGYNLVVDKSFLHPAVFQNTRSLYLGTSIALIEQDLFKSWTRLERISFSMLSLKSFFYKCGLEWTNSLNSNLNYTVSTTPAEALASTIVLIFIQTNENYAGDYENATLSFPNYPYPDEDLCLFANFPHEKFVLPILQSEISECTCTVTFLLKNYDLFASYAAYSQNINQALGMAASLRNLCVQNSYQTNDSCLNQTYLQQKTEQCNLTISEKRKDAWYTYSDQTPNFDAKAIKFFFVVVFNPIFCVLGICSSVAIIRAVASKTKESKEPFFIFMSLNAKCNCIYSFIHLFNLMSTCIEPAGVYCSSVWSTFFAQYFKTAVIVYLGETVKTCANLAYLLMSINRYLLVNKKPGILFTKLASFPVKNMILIMIPFSLLFNIIVILEYQITYPDRKRQDILNPEYPIAGRTKSLSVTILLLMHQTFNVTVFWLINTVIEVHTVKKLSVALREKRHRLAGPGLSHEQLVKKIEADCKSDRKAVVMVVINSIVNFILRLPEFFVFLKYTTSITSVSGAIRLQLLIYKPLFDIVETFFIMTFTTNFLVFYKLNRQFRSFFQEVTK
jgi:hypothetical protein